MSKAYKYLLLIVIVSVLLLGLGALGYAFYPGTVTIHNPVRIDRLPGLYPDYARTVIPPNIAPLNFFIKEKGSFYAAKIYSKQGQPIEIFSRSGKIIIPQAQWRDLLDLNRSEQLNIDVFVKDPDGKWDSFSTVTVTIAPDNIDSTLVYRKMHPLHDFWINMGIYQRNLQNYEQTALLEARWLKPRRCINCHTFCNNKPDKMLIRLRGFQGGSGTLAVAGDTARVLDAKLGYACWHPSGKLVAYSINKVRQFWHAAEVEIRDVIDLDSRLAYYLVESDEIKTAPSLETKIGSRPTQPGHPTVGICTSISAPIPWPDRSTVPPENYKQAKYDLVRVSYDVEQDRWGQIEPVVSAQQTGGSMLIPRISPDGRWLTFCMCDYGAFPIHRKCSDLYIIDLKAAEQSGRYEYRRLEINSDQSESWHSWSSNSRWIAFSSKRHYGKFTRIYISYIDKDGKSHKAFLLPQKDPLFYDSCLETYTVPELVTEPVKVAPETLARVVRAGNVTHVDMPVTMATPTAESASPWLERE